MTTDTHEGTQVPVRRIDLLQDKWHRQGRYSRNLSPEARRALSGWTGVDDNHVALLAFAVREENTVERTLRGAMRGFHKGGVSWQAVDHLRNGPLNTRDLAYRMDITMEAVLKVMDRLQARGVVRATGTDMDATNLHANGGGRLPTMWELNPGEAE